MNTLNEIGKALKLSQERLSSAPDFELFQIINTQLEYLYKVVTGEETDRSRLKEINIGLYAIREFEESDPDFASALRICQYVAEKLARGLKLPACK